LRASRAGRKEKEGRREERKKIFHSVLRAKVNLTSPKVVQCEIKNKEKEKFTQSEQICRTRAKPQHIVATRLL
jgi:hypothetical protein